MVVLVIGLVSALLVIDVSSLLMSGGFRHPGHLVDHLLSVFFLRKDGDVLISLCPVIKRKDRRTASSLVLGLLKVAL